MEIWKDRYSSSLLDFAEYGGQDQIYGGEGDDFIVAGEDNDYVEGNEGSDDIIGGHNSKYGQPGHDVLYGNEGDDYILVSSFAALKRFPFPHESYCE